MANVTEDPNQTQAPAPPPPPSSGSKGCLYGCLAIVLSGVALFVCAGVGGYWFLTTQVKKYTSTTPVELPTVEYSEEKLTELEGRVDAFTGAFEDGGTPEEDLILTAEELNALIAKNDEMRGKVFVRIEDGQVSGDLSIPTDAIPGGKGRYFNGSASFDVSMDGGVLIVTLADAEVNGERIPQEAIDAMANENLAKELYKDPDSAKVLSQFEEVSIEGDKIILKVRHPTEDAEGEGAKESGDGESVDPEKVNENEDSAKPADATSSTDDDSESAPDPPSDDPPSADPPSVESGESEDADAADGPLPTK